MGALLEHKAEHIHNHTGIIKSRRLY